jgi:hypothetical protein
MALITNRNQIPSGITTYEQLALWLGSVLYFLMGSRDIQIYPNEPATKQAQFSMVMGQDGKTYALITQIIPVDWAVFNGPDKPWIAGVEVTSAQPHNNLLTN